MRGSLAIAQDWVVKVLPILALGATLFSQLLFSLGLALLEEGELVLGDSRAHHFCT